MPILKKHAQITYTLWKILEWICLKNKTSCLLLSSQTPGWSGWSLRPIQPWWWLTSRLWPKSPTRPTVASSWLLTTLSSPHISRLNVLIDIYIRKSAFSFVIFLGKDIVRSIFIRRKLIRLSLTNYACSSIRNFLNTNLTWPSQSNRSYLPRIKIWSMSSVL